MITNDNAMNSKMLVVAAISATASSLLTYSVFKWYKRCQVAGSNSVCPGGPTASAAYSSSPMSGTDAIRSLPPLSGHQQRAPADPYDHRPRKGYLSWDDYFMAVAFLSAQRSKDPNKQVGACIVDRTNIICGIGYNGFPRGCSDNELPWAKRSRVGDHLETKYPYVCHAEMNAILNKNGASVAGARVYVTMFPCNECAKLMIQAGISEIVYHEDKAQPRAETPAPGGGFKISQQYAASKRLLSLAGVKLRQHIFQRPVTITLSNYNNALPMGVPRGVGGEEQEKAEAEAGGADVPAPPHGKEVCDGSTTWCDGSTAMTMNRGESGMASATGPNSNGMAASEYVSAKGGGTSSCTAGAMLKVLAAGGKGDDGEEDGNFQTMAELSTSRRSLNSSSRDATPREAKALCFEGF